MTIEKPSVRQNISSGSPWETVVAYSRAVNVNGHVFVAGTTASNESGEVQSPGDPFGQTVFVLKKIEQALAECGGSLADVVRTRIFVTNIKQWEEIGRAHQKFFAGINPACTMVEVSRLVSDGLLVEIEADALIV
jgi:enamine deaminase RidA (YjgF/YER057c/UK114 family)